MHLSEFVWALLLVLVVFNNFPLIDATEVRLVAIKSDFLSH